MQADLDDAPIHIQRKQSDKRLFLIIMGIICSATALFTLVEIEPKTIKLPDTQEPKKIFETTGQITRTEIEEVKTPDTSFGFELEDESETVVIQPARTPKTIEIEKPTKQTVFNAQNYTPRQATNVVRNPEANTTAQRRTIQEDKNSNSDIKVTVVKQEPSMKDRACWVYRDGSVEQRECRIRVGLNHRD